MSIRKALTFFFLFWSTALLGQIKKDTSYISNKSLVGVWQFGDWRVGNGLSQNFEFYSNGKFVFHNGKNGDDLVSTITLKGGYRLFKNSLFFTFTSRVILTDSKIGTVNVGTDYGIFEFEDAKQKEVKETTSKENPDPAFITVINNNHIKINNENYYRIDPKLLKEQHFSPDVH